MNSDEEKALFEAYGWEQDLIKRQWVAPDGYVITYDQLVASTETFSKDLVEAALRGIIKLHGEEKH